MSKKEKDEDVEVCHQYRIGRVLSHYSARSDRSALRSLDCGHSFVGWEDSVLDIQALWRSCVVDQSEMDWGRLGHNTPWVMKIKTLQAVNCPPVGVITVGTDEEPYPRNNPCQLTMICPFCWCRRHVEEIFKRFYSGLFKYRKKRPELLLVNAQFSVERRSAICVKTQAQNDKADELIRQSIGSLALHLAEPTGSYGQPFKMTQRVLAVVDRKSPYVKTLGRKRWTKCTNLREAIPKQLVFAVGQVARYPARMLNGHSKNQEIVKRLLEAFTPDLRMMEFYGGLRGPKREEMAWPDTESE